MDQQIQLLRKQIAATESQLRNLRRQLQQAEIEAEAARQVDEAYRGGMPAEWIGEALGALQQGHGLDIVPNILHDPIAANTLSTPQVRPKRWPLDDEEYKRYGRQLIMPETGLHGQLRLKNVKVLIVGVGGLGCPAAAYLAGAGVGTVGLMDGDSVEVSNLHRQIAHSSDRTGMSKVDSAVEYLASYVEMSRYLSDHDLISSF